MSHPIKRLVRLVARAFYAGDCPPKDHDDGEAGATGRGSSRNKVATAGLAIVILDYLTEHEWVAEAMMLDQIKVHQKILRRALKYLEREHFLMSEHRRETAARKDVVNAVTTANAAASAAAAAALAANGDEEEVPDDGFQARPPKGLTISYYAIDYPCFFDALQLKLYLMRKALKDELETAHAIQDYACSTAWCGKRFTSLDAAMLIDRSCGELICDICQAPLQQLLASGGVGDEKERKARREVARVLLQRMDIELREITNLVAQCKNVASPHPGTLLEWAQEQQTKRQLAAAAGGGNAGNRGGHAGGSGGSRGGAGGALGSVPWQETQIKVNLQGSVASTSAAAVAPGGTRRPGAAGGTAQQQAAAAAAAEAAAAAAAGPAAPPKPAPIPWFTQKGGASGSGRPSEDKKEDGKTAQESAVYQAFVQQYMAQLQQQQKQQQQQQQQQQAQHGLQADPHASSGQEVAASPGGQLPLASQGMEEDVEWEDI